MRAPGLAALQAVADRQTWEARHEAAARARWAPILVQVDATAAALEALAAREGPTLETLAGLPLEDWAARGLGQTGEVAGLRTRLREARQLLGSTQVTATLLHDHAARLNSWRLWWGRDEPRLLADAAGFLSLPVELARLIRGVHVTWRRLVPVLEASGVPPAMVPTMLDPLGPPDRGASKTDFDPRRL